AAGRRIDAEIGDEAVLGRDPGQHSRAEPFGPETPDRLVAGPGEDAGMPVQDGADVEPLPDARDDLVDDRAVDLAPVLAVLVERCERARLRIRSLDPRGGHRIVDEVESFVRLLDGKPRLCGQVRGCLDPRADDGERAAGHCRRVRTTTRSGPDRPAAELEARGRKPRSAGRGPGRSPCPDTPPEVPHVAFSS